MDKHKHINNVKELVTEKIFYIEKIFEINERIRISQKNEYNQYLPTSEEEKTLLLNILKNTQSAKEYIENELVIEETLNSMCDHMIVEDYIDISPDHSQKIKYCCLCETSFL